jgi:tRNA nucleotidyltransferase (CCA-adding enzyme)
MTVKIYKVGGCVRDKILGVVSKDIDFSVEASSYEEMKAYILGRGKIFVEKPEYLTIRAMINGEAADFVLARKDGAYHDGRRPDAVELGTLNDDLARRDFTMNAIAEDENGNFIDPFNGIADIKAKVIRCVGNAEDRLKEDALRMLRAIRFVITKDFMMHNDIAQFIFHNADLLKNVSEDRIRDELTKCFAANTLHTIVYLSTFGNLQNYIFKSTKIWLKPTSSEN